MARARPENTTSKQSPQDDLDREPDGPAADPPGFGDETITDMGGPRAESLLRDDAMRRLPDPRAQQPARKADATAKNRRETEHDIASARALGGERFAALEAAVARAKTRLLDAPDGADLPALQAAYRAAKHDHDEAAAMYAAEARKKAEVKRYRVVDNNAGKGRLASTPGSHGRARLSPGKVIDSLNYDVAALRSQGVKLEEIRDEDEAA